MSGHETVRAQLQSRLDVLLRRVSAIGRDLRRPGNPDWKERAVEVENDDVLEGLDDASRDEVAQIRAALARLDAGTYGRCARCGSASAPPRLLAMPSATICVSCAR